ncbi:hypothetical protein ACTU3I_02630 [Microbacterium sp. RD1]|uniref:hypothetical protein n=1 Tax=Microbacterium sp. RD1 TaxID=3457313 RepID=UPI003FA58069
MSSSYAPSAASADTVEEALRAVRAARDRVAVLPPRVARLADDVDWESDTAWLFRRRVDDLRREIEHADRCLDDAVTALRGASIRLRSAAPVS